VDRLRADGDAVISLVATIDGALVGHEMLSRMSAPFRALGLAPIAVSPDWRGKGIAARLIRDGIKLAQNDNWAGIFVLGDPAYYQRFGFSAGQAEKFETPYAGPYLMALALQGNDLPCPTGRIDYAPAFSALG
jgi:putative acetyltransferase